MLIETYQGDLSKITIREISGRIHISAGLINYHFGNKQKLMEACVQKIIAGIVKAYRPEVLSPSFLAEKEAFLFQANLLWVRFFLFFCSSILSAMYPFMEEGKYDINMI